MTKCPTCNRSYAENFSYCLDDGTPLRHSNYDEPTVVIPQPQATSRIPPHTSPATTRERSAAPIILGVTGVIVAILLLGTIAVGIWLYSRDQRVANQNSNSGPPGTIASTSPSPSPSYNPLKPLNANSSPSPSASAEVPETEPKIEPGTYQCEVTRNLGETTKQAVAIRLMVTVSKDGTYSTRGYMTIPEANIHNQLGIEEKGTYSQSGDTLILTNRRERQFNLETNSWMRWGVPADGSESREEIRDVTQNTFQLLDDESKTWYTFSKVQSNDLR
jgi:hypothetical protein